MCAVSIVGDYWRDSLPQKPYYPAIEPFMQPLGLHRCRIPKPIAEERRMPIHE